MREPSLRRSPEANRSRRSEILTRNQPYTNRGVRKLFSKVPGTYELVNHILTLGLDTVWRRKAATIAAGAGGTRWIDVCTGTGEMASYLSQLAGAGTHVYATDFSLPMLYEAATKPHGKHLRFALSDVRSLPFDDHTFDLVTISFATRNINLHRNALVQCLSEFHRVLKPGGCFLNLETTQPSSPLIRKLFHLYVRLFVKRIGALVSGSRPAYAYLSKTIPRFYPADELEALLRLAGFDRIQSQRLFPGTTAVHWGFKTIGEGGASSHRRFS